MSIDDFRNNLACELKTVGIEDDDLLEYIEGILADDVLSMEERKESVLEIVTGAADSNYDEAGINSVVESLIKHQEHHVTQQRIEEAAAPAPPKKSVLTDLVVEEPISPNKKTDEDSTAEEELEKAFWSSGQKADEMHESKRRIVEQYAVEFDDTVEFTEDGTMKSGLKEAGISSKLASSSSNVDETTDAWANDNRAQVQRAALAQREQAKAEHEKEQARIKLQKQKEQQKKEKEKQRVSKKERKSGR